MSTPASPSPRRQLGAELRRLRDHGGRTAAEVAGRLGWSESKLSRIETARIGVRPGDLELLLDAYEVDESRRRDLRRIGEQAQRNRNWWYAYSSALPDAYEEYIAFESEAAEMFEWQAQVVPGLLQTDEYARAVIEAGSTPDEPAVIEQRVALRMARQSVLTRHPDPRLWVVLDEAVLRRQVGGPAVMRRQVRRLHEASGRPGITVQVLPLSAGVHRALAGSFVIFAFGGTSPPVVHSEGLTGGVFRARPGEVAAYRAAFDAVCALALDPDATRELLAATAADPENS